MNKNKKLILASCSPRRRELIKFLGLPFECISVDADESTAHTNPEAAVKEIASKKAHAAFSGRENSANEIIIGADTVVVYNGKMLGKPSDDADAEKTLLSLSGKKHAVYTGVSLIYINKEGEVSELSFAEKTEVYFAEISLSDIKKYIATGNHKDKAGSYAIQDEFSVHVKGINGDYNNVVGFPVARIYQELTKIT